MSNNIFVCVEIDTDDIIIWSNIDQAMAKKIGLTHIVWGVRQESKKPSHFSLPSNLFCGCTTSKPSDICSMIKELIREYWSGVASVVVIDSEVWHYSTLGNERSTTKVLTQQEEEEFREMERPE